MKTCCRAFLLFGLVVGASTVLSFASSADAAGKTRTYYIAADEVTWDYAPGGINQITGRPFAEAESFWVASGPHQIGKIVKKAQYREYTDATFTQLKARPKGWEHLGFLGPLLRAEVGDTIHVIFPKQPDVPREHASPRGVLSERI